MEPVFWHRALLDTTSPANQSSPVFILCREFLEQIAHQDRHRESVRSQMSDAQMGNVIRHGESVLRRIGDW